jgi:hypothetical protein
MGQMLSVCFSKGSNHDATSKCDMDGGNMTMNNVPTYLKNIKIIHIVIWDKNNLIIVHTPYLKNY